MSVSPLPPLPTWTDPGAVTSYIVSIAGLVVGILMAFGVAVPSGEPQAVQVGASVAGLIVSGVAQAVNLIMHRKATVAIAQAQAAIAAQK